MSLREGESGRGPAPGYATDITPTTPYHDMGWNKMAPTANRPKNMVRARKNVQIEGLPKCLENVGS